MLRLILLSAPAMIIMAGFSVPFAIDGFVGYLSALLLVLIGSAVLWIIERKTIAVLEKDSLLNKILNTIDGPD